MGMNGPKRREEKRREEKETNTKGSEEAKCKRGTNVPGERIKRHTHADQTRTEQNRTPNATQVQASS